MLDQNTEAVFDERTDKTDKHSDDPQAESRREAPPTGSRLDRSFASEYIDELIIAILRQRGTANGMDIIREFAHRFGVQFSPGTVYPHLHSLEAEGVLSCRECVQTKEYCIEDTEAAQAYIDSVLAQMSCLSTFLDATGE